MSFSQLSESLKARLAAMNLNPARVLYALIPPAHVERDAGTDVLQNQVSVIEISDHIGVLHQENARLDSRFQLLLADYPKLSGIRGINDRSISARTTTSQIAE
jgi:hypothetical protein